MRHRPLFIVFALSLLLGSFDARAEDPGDAGAAPPDAAGEGDAQLETTEPDGVGVSIPSPGPAWESSEDVDDPVRLRYHHPELDATLSLFVLDALEFDDDPGDLLAPTMIEAWDEQFRGAGPLVTVIEHEAERTFGDAITGVYGHLRFRGEREGLYFGFSSEALARTLGATLTYDRFAFFILVEGPAEHSEQLQEAFRATLQNLKGHL